MYKCNEAPHSKLRGIKAELRRSQPVFALPGFDAVRPAIHPCSKLQRILAKANKIIEFASPVNPPDIDSAGALRKSQDFQLHRGR